MLLLRRSVAIGCCAGPYLPAAAPESRANVVEMSSMRALTGCLRGVRTHTATPRRWGSAFKRIGTQLAQAGCATDPGTGAITPPIHLSSTFERDEDLTYSRGFNYARHGNPTRAALERTMAEIEGGAHGHAFASGMTAATSVLLALPNCYAVLPDDLYHGVYVAAESVFAAWGFRHQQVDMTRHEVRLRFCLCWLEGWCALPNNGLVGMVQEVTRALEDAATTDAPHVVVWVETPSNPSVKVTDIAAVVQSARNLVPSERLYVVCDSTWTTPVLTRPIDLGKADHGVENEH